jgi:hypothetical protein
MDVAYPRAALDIIASTLVTSMLMLVFALIAFRGEKMAFPRGILVIGSLVLQASCIGTIWLHEGKGIMSTVLLVVAIVTVVGLAIVAIYRDPIWKRFRR